MKVFITGVSRPDERTTGTCHSSLLASPFILLLAFGIFAVIFLFLGHFETSNFLPDHCTSPPGLELEDRREAVHLNAPNSTVLLLHREPTVVSV